MLRISKQADYGIYLLSHFVGEEQSLHSARDLAAISGLPLPTVSKILKILTRAGILESQRGSQGGYVLARPANHINAEEIIAALDGPVALVECSTVGEGHCEHEPICPSRSSLHRINEVVRQALQNMSLAEMASPPTSHAPIPVSTKTDRPTLSV